MTTYWIIVDGESLGLAELDPVEVEMLTQDDGITVIEQ